MYTVRSHTIEPKGIIDPCNEVDVRAYGFAGVFYLFYLLFYMIYLFEIESEIDLKLSIERADDLVGITIQANNHINEVWLNEGELYELIGVLHLVQNQIKKK